MTTLITGGAGFIGSRLARALVEAGEQVVVLDALHPQVHGTAPDLSAFDGEGAPRLVRADVGDAAAWRELLDSMHPSTVVHLAAETGTGQSLREPSRHTGVNVHGTGVMLEALSDAGVVPERILLASSRAVYGEGRWQDPADGAFFYPGPRPPDRLADGVWSPTAPSGAPGRPTANAAAEVEPRPTNVYAATKLAQEHLLDAWATAFGAELTVLRLQNVYGAGQAVGNPYTGVLTYFARELSRGREIHVFEGGGIVRDFVHVRDVVAAMIAALGRTSDERAPKRLLDVGSGRPAVLADHAETMQRVAGKGRVVITDEFRPGDVRAAYADIAPTVATLGVEPQVDFEDGVEELVAWVAAQPDS